jgi:signal transduction histidine kinase
LGVVSSEVKRLSRLVQSMLSLAKLESGELKVNKSNFDFTDLLFSILISQEQRIVENKLEISGLENIERVYLNADYDLIYQVAYNLIDNAIKFTNPGGTITFKIEQFKDKTTFKIHNTGEGIDEKDLPFIFDRFYKTDRSRSNVKDSTGLGLYIANTIISIHGGEMSVESVKNGFTEFSFTLPTNNG